MNANAEAAQQSKQLRQARKEEKESPPQAGTRLRVVDSAVPTKTTS